jgi:hypothetical protein
MHTYRTEPRQIRDTIVVQEEIASGFKSMSTLSVFEGVATLLTYKPVTIEGLGLVYDNEVTEGKLYLSSRVSADLLDIS